MYVNNVFFVGVDKRCFVRLMQYNFFTTQLLSVKILAFFDNLKKIIVFLTVSIKTPEQIVYILNLVNALQTHFL